MSYPILQNQKVVVTGGAGFIGSNLCESFLRAGNCVTCLDNFSSGKRKNIEEFLGNKNFVLVEGDIRELKTCKTVVKDADFVFHHAALASVQASVEDPILNHEINSTGFVNILVAARDARVKRVVYASSSSVYGNETDLPITEAKLGKPLSPYAVTKLSDEYHASVFTNLYGLSTIGLRYFNIFGKKQDPEGAYAAVIPKFVQLLLAKKAPTIFGDGNQTRDFAYIENVLEMNHRAALTTLHQAQGTVYNVAYSEKISINDLYQLLVELLGVHDPQIKSLRPIYVSGRQGEVKHSFASIQKAKDLLEYDPQYDLKRGMVESIKWYRENLSV